MDNKLSVKKLSRLRFLYKMIGTEINNMETELLGSLKSNPVPNVSIIVRDGQVRPKWKEEFISLASKAGLNTEYEIKKIQDKTERGSSTVSITIGTEFEPDIETIKEMVIFLEKE